MKNITLGNNGIVAVTTLFLSLTAGLAGAVDHAPLTPEYAAKKENYRKQKEQQITQEKRKAAAENLKAERLKVYNAKQAVKRAKPDASNNK